MEATHEDFHGRVIDRRRVRCHALAVIVLPWMLATASILTIFTSRRIFFGGLGSGMVATVLLGLVSSWPFPPPVPPSLAGKPPLPLPAPPAAPNASEAAAAFQRAVEAAKSGNLAAVKQGVSEEVLNTLDGNNGWEEAISWLREQEIRHFGKKTKIHRDNDDGPWSTSIFIEGAGSGGPMRMIFEDGEWRIAGNPLIRFR